MTTRRLAAVALLLACAKPARVDLDPPSLRFGLRGQASKVHATPRERDGRPVPDQVCRWSSTDEKVATVAGPHNDATVTAVGPGAAAVRCTIGDLVAEVPVIVRVVTRVTVKPDPLEVRIQDEPAPAALTVQAFDDAGQPVLGRSTWARCLDDAVCRGDGRGQVWGVAPGTSRAVVEVDGARAEIAVKVVDARTAAGRPQRVTGNPMEEVERAVNKRLADEAKAKAKAAGAAAPR
jgi:Bacterial Ig-like domain (group 2)